MLKTMPWYAYLIHAIVAVIGFKLGVALEDARRKRKRPAPIQRP